jgi:hypothetical protein
MAGLGGDANAGSGGMTNGGAGATFGGAGSGTTGGGSGAAGTSTGGSAGVAGALTCAERCNVDADCRIFSSEASYRCNATLHRCERFGEPCRSSAECLPEASFWLFGCRSDMDCFFFSNERCVDVGGTGRCARVAPSANGCDYSNPDEVTLPLFGGSGTVLVCANASLACDGGECVPGCSSNADCSPARNGSVCDTTTRLCRCVRDEDCGGAGVSRCAVATGRCECADAGECSEVPNSNACQSGRCGCSGVSACTGERTFSGTTFVCE